jgi:parallel beta-helix repeat protein
LTGFYAKYIKKGFQNRKEKLRRKKEKTMHNASGKPYLFTLAILISLISLVVQPYHSAQAAPMLFTVTKTADSGTGTLRWAIEQANANSGHDFIDFNIPMTDSGYDPQKGIWTIYLQTPLILTNPGGVQISGVSQTENKGDTNPLGPEIAISGSSLTSGPIFDLQADNNVIAGFALHSNNTGAAIDIGSSSRNNLIIYNYIGIRADQSLGLTNKYGIRILSGSHSNTIRNNIISNNQNDGIEINGPAGNNWIWVNTIGMDPDRSVKLANGGHGIALYSSHDNLIELNSISGNGKSGILINGGFWNTVEENIIGLDATGLVAIGNLEFGIKLENGTRENMINDNFAAGNGKTGIFLTGNKTWGNKLENNKIGGSPSNPIPNGHHGIGLYEGTHDNVVGHLDDSGRGNWIYSSHWSGIAIVNSANFNTIANNRIGSPGVGMNYHGIAIVNSSDNAIELNTIAGNGVHTEAAGVLVDGIAAPAIHNRITQNSIYNNNNLGIKLINNGNEGIVPPVITTVTSKRVQGTACPGCTVEIFSDDVDQGRFFEGSATADPVGVWEWLGTPRGPYVTATQTDVTHNTSSFSIPFKFTSNKIYLPLITR